jgi:hypothetical protein
MQGKDSTCSAGKVLKKVTVKVVLDALHKRWKLKLDIKTPLSSFVSVSLVRRPKASGMLLTFSRSFFTTPPYLHRLVAFAMYVVLLA